MRVSIIAAAVCALAIGGCVKKSEYEALSGKLADTAAQLKGETEKADGLEKALADAQQAASILSQEMEQKVAELERALAAEQARSQALDGELAGIVKDKSRLQESAEKLKQALAELAARKAEADKRVAEFKGLLEKFKSLIDAGKLKVKIIDGRMVLVLPSDILFASGSANLSEDGVAAVAEVARVLASMPDRKFQVEGHTDDIPIKKSKYESNWELAFARALGVTEAMIDAGMSGTLLSAASFGEFRPAGPNTTPEGRAANRRIEIVLVPDLSSLPGFADLQKTVEGR